MKYKKNSHKIFAIIFLVITGSLTGYLVAGFFYPDPYFMKVTGRLYKLIFVGLPILTLAFFYLALVFLFIKNERKLWANFTLLIGTVAFVVLVLYPVADIFYYRHLNRLRTQQQEMNAFLQLNPPVPDPVLVDEGINKVKVFCLGGSTTEFKNATGKGWPELVEEKLMEGNGMDSIRFFNLGKQWYTSLHTLLNYETNLRPYNPDVIVVMHAINDLLINADFSYFSKGKFRRDYGHFYGPVANIYERKGFFGLIWTELNKFWYHHPRKKNDQENFPGLVSFEKNLNTLIDLATIDNSQVILVTQPYLYTADMSDDLKKVCTMVNREAVGPYEQWSYSTALKGMQVYNQKIREIAEVRGVVLIDLEDTVPKSLDYFIDDVHYSEKAFGLIADYIALEFNQRVLNKSGSE